MESGKVRAVSFGDVLDSDPSPSPSSAPPCVPVRHEPLRHSMVLNIPPNAAPRLLQHQRNSLALPNIPLNAAPNPALLLQQLQPRNSLFTDGLFPPLLEPDMEKKYREMRRRQSIPTYMDFVKDKPVKQRSIDDNGLYESMDDVRFSHDSDEDLYIAPEDVETPMSTSVDNSGDEEGTDANEINPAAAEQEAQETVDVCADEDADEIQNPTDDDDKAEVESILENESSVTLSIGDDLEEIGDEETYMDMAGGTV